MGRSRKFFRRGAPLGEEGSTEAAPGLPSGGPAGGRVRARFPRWGWWLLLPVAGLVALIAAEIVASPFQARVFHRISRSFGFQVEAGRSPLPLPPANGPYDQRLGYSRLSEFSEKLETAGYEVERQARPSELLQKLGAFGLFPIYHEKSQAGLRVLDRSGRLLYQAQYPARVYDEFEAVPEVVVAALLFIENREALDPRHPGRNPAIDWSRLGKAFGVKALSVIDGNRKTIGGSTLATQIEKFRHSPEGRTLTARDKLRQMLSASLRAYQDGENTLHARRRIVVDYINSVPLAAAAGWGEVNGIGDGLWAWFGRDFREFNGLLDAPDETEAAALAFKEVLSLFLAQRRPSYYLLEDRGALDELADSYLRLLAREGAITPRLRDLALEAKLVFQKRAVPERPVFADRKGANLLRGRLSSQLDLPSFYDLDRLDLTVSSTLDGPSQTAVSRFLRSLKDPAVVAAAGLKQHRLLQEGDPAGVVYTFTLYERTPSANVIRVQTDSLGQPLDLNDGMKLDLGSTAKLRTLVTYLDIIANLHARYVDLSAKELREVQIGPRDRLSAWAVSHLSTAKDRSLATMLEAALDRRYSAGTGEAFFTGGGLHTFSNFKREDDNRIMPVREAMRHSVNLVFIRMMRDIVNYYMFQITGSTAQLLEDSNDPRRKQYLARFADQEGSEFLRRFYRKHQGKALGESLELVFSGARPTRHKIATVLLSVKPRAGLDELRDLLAHYLPGENLSDVELQKLREKYSPANYSLVDRGYIARTHPLELWVMEFLRRQPEATLGQALEASASQRQEVYGWLFKTHRKGAQDRRIATLLETEAFLEIHAAWQKLGYPFAYLQPSLATSIGSSGDRPGALAELMGILANDGVRLPMARAERLHFAAGTPYETVFKPRERQGERVLAPEVAQVVRRSLLDVVEDGTAQRLRKSLARADGTKRIVGGKTGTGDERFERFGRGGQLIESRFVSRAAVFSFLIDERFFGVLTAYVHGPEAGRYGFTSALPVQILGILLPELAPLLDGGAPVPERNAVASVTAPLVVIPTSSHPAVPAAGSLTKAQPQLGAAFAGEPAAQEGATTHPTLRTDSTSELPPGSEREAEPGGPGAVPGIVIPESAGSEPPAREVEGETPTPHEAPSRREAAEKPTRVPTPSDAPRRVESGAKVVLGAAAPKPQRRAEPALAREPEKPRSDLMNLP
jgi:membrane peptidoglycan carboxypeptidase